MRRYKARGMKRNNRKMSSNNKTLQNDQKDQFSGIKRGFQLIKDYYVLIPVFFLYMGFIYVQGMTGSWLRTMMAYGKGSLIDFIEPNLYKESLNKIIDIIEGMISTFQFGIMPVSVEFYIINGITFISKFILSCIVAIFVAYVVRIIFLQVQQYNIWSKIRIKYIKKQFSKNEMVEYVVNGLFLGIVFFMGYFYLKQKIRLEDSFNMRHFPFTEFRVEFNLEIQEYIMGIVKIAVYVGSIFFGICISLVLRKYVKKLPLLFKSFVIIALLFIFTYSVAFSYTALLVFQQNVFISELVFNVYVILIYFIVYKLFIKHILSNRKERTISQKILPVFFVFTLFITGTFNAYYLAYVTQYAKIMNFIDGKERLPFAKVTLDAKQTDSSQIASNNSEKIYMKIDVSKDYFIGLDMAKMSIVTIPNKFIKNITFTYSSFDYKDAIEYKTENINKINKGNQQAAETVKHYYDIGTNIEQTNLKELLNLVYPNFFDGKPMEVLEKERKIKKQFNRHNIEDFIGYQIFIVKPETYGDIHRILVKEYWVNMERCIEYEVSDENNKIINMEVKEVPYL